MDRLIDPLAEAARHEPARLAVADRRTRWTFAELDAAAWRVTGGLRDVGVTRGTRVALVADESVSTVATIHAVRRIGGVLAPLNRRGTPAELVGQLDAIGASVIVHDGTTSDLAASVGRACAALPRPLSIAELLRSPTPAVIERSAGADDDSSPATLVFTSGTAGRPRAALLTLRAQAASAEAWADFLRPAGDDRWLACLPFHHVAGLGIVDRAARWAVGVVVEPGFEPAVVHELIESEGITHVSVVGSMLGRLLDVHDPLRPAPSLRAILVGGEPADPQRVQQAARDGLPVIPTYGLTETSSGITALAPDEAADQPDSVGRPLRGVELRIRADGGPATPGGLGEIEVRGPMLFSGYVERSVDGIVDPRVDRWLATGDLGTVDADGRLALADRRDDLLISGGENIAPAEVETVLRAHPAIADAAVGGRPDGRRGAVPIAAIVIRPGFAPTDAELAAHCRALLAAFKVPMAFIRVDAIPRSGGGKILRRAIRDLAGSEVLDG